MLKSVRQPRDHPGQTELAENDPLQRLMIPQSWGINRAVNHAPITRS